jgi:hypothetical protein
MPVTYLPTDEELDLHPRDEKPKRRKKRKKCGTSVIMKNE